MTVLNKSATPPFEPDGQTLPNEELRLTHRYLDLRRPALQKNMIMRHNLARVVRDYFNSRNFLEVETPMLGRSTPEGPATISFPAACMKAAFLRFRSRRSCTSRR